MTDAALLSQLAEILGKLPDETLAQIERDAPRELERRVSGRKLQSYRPYPKQREFHASGAEYRERLLMAGNQLGKTLAAGMEVAAHMTGIYPPDWEGRRFDKPTRWLAGSESAELTRKGVQRILLGPPEVKTDWGTGAIPKESLLGTMSRQGIPDAVATITVKHMPSGGTSTLQLASYDQGRTKWQADTVDGVWLDEECDLDIYTEALTRTNATGGMVMMTFTPLKGVSDVVRRFLIEKSPGTHVTRMTLDDVDHFTPEMRAAIIASYPLFERDARTRGEPQLGSGRVFPIDRSQVACAAIPVPDHWAVICGIDFGWQHPSAGVMCAWDRDADVFYVTAAFRAKEQTPMMFAGAVKPWGEWPWSWPHDGHQSAGKFGGQDQQQLAQIYKQHGLNMLATHATFENGTNGLEAGIAEMLERMQTGRFKVFSHLNDWFEEFGLFHRKDGIIVKENDDLIAATRYAYMMRRAGKTRSEIKAKRKKSVYGEMPTTSPYGWMAT